MTVADLVSIVKAVRRLQKAAYSKAHLPIVFELDGKIIDTNEVRKAEKNLDRVISVLDNDE